MNRHAAPGAGACLITDIGALALSPDADYVGPVVADPFGLAVATWC